VEAVIAVEGVLLINWRSKKHAAADETLNVFCIIMCRRVYMSEKKEKSYVL
jgi:hypothetical protein